MKRILIVCAFCVASLVSLSPAFAQRTSDYRILVVNTAQVLRDAVASESLRAQLSVRQESLNAESERLQEEFKEEQRLLEERKDLMTQKAYTKQTLDMQEKWEERQRVFQQKVADLQAGLERSSVRIRNAFNGVLSEVFTREEADIILDSGVVLTHYPEYDITAEVLRSLNKSLPYVELVVVTSSDEEDEESEFEEDGEEEQ